MTFEMTLSRDEFFRLLPGAVGRFEVHGNTVTPTGPERGWTVRLVPLPDHALGAVALPRLQVELTLEAAGTPEAEAFLARFRQAFLRGGG